MVLDFLPVDNFDFTTKIVKKINSKLVKMLGLNFWTKNEDFEQCVFMIIFAESQSYEIRRWIDDPQW